MLSTVVDFGVVVAGDVLEESLEGAAAVVAVEGAVERSSPETCGRSGWDWEVAFATGLFAAEVTGEEAVELGTEGGAEVEGVTEAVLLGVPLPGVLCGTGGGDTLCAGIKGTIEVGSGLEVELFLGGIFGGCAVLLFDCAFGSGGRAFVEEEATGVVSPLGVFELPFEMERAFMPTIGIS